MDSILALQAASITGAFTLPESAARSGSMREGVDAHARVLRELAVLRSEAKKERQMNRRVELNTQIKQREAEVANLLNVIQQGSAK